MAPGPVPCRWCAGLAQRRRARRWGAEGSGGRDGLGGDDGPRHFLGFVSVPVDHHFGVATTITTAFTGLMSQRDNGIWSGRVRSRESDARIPM